MRIGFLGFGEAASSIAAGLSGEGVVEMSAYDILLNDSGKQEQVVSRIEQSGAKPAYTPGEAVKAAEVVFSVVPAGTAVTMAESAAGYLEAGSLYVDVTTASPREKRKIADLTEERGARFVDGAMMGPLLQYRHQVPMLLSGSGSGELVQVMEPYHMNMTAVNEIPGAATSIKFIRSITAKGLACLLFEALQAAQHFHVEELIVDSLCESYGKGFEKVIDGYISGTVIHAGRREHEMQNGVDFLKESGLPAGMAEAARQKLEGIAQLELSKQFADGVPRNWRGVLEGWGL